MYEDINLSQEWKKTKNLEDSKNFIETLLCHFVMLQTNPENTSERKETFLMLLNREVCLACHPRLKRRSVIPSETRSEETNWVKVSQRRTKLGQEFFRANSFRFL